MKRTILLSMVVASVVILSLAGIAQSQAGKGSFSAVWDAIDELKDEVQQLWSKTNDLQSQIDSIDAPAPPPGPQPMAVDAFLKIDGIPGESTDEGHPGWIEVVSYSYSISPAGHGEFRVTKMLDKASPKLCLYASGGQYIEEVTLEAFRPNGTMRYTISKVVVKELDKASPKLAEAIASGGGVSVGEALPLEEVSFSYGQIQWEYTLADGNSVQTGWDTVESRPMEEVPYS